MDIALYIVLAAVALALIPVITFGSLVALYAVLQYLFGDK